MRILYKIITLALLLQPAALFPQQVAIKSNAAYWATTTPNISVETALGIKITLDLQFGYNPFC